MDISSFSRSQLQLNQRGTSLLCRDLAKSVKVCWVSYEKVVYKDDALDLASKSDIDKFTKSSKNILFAYLNIREP